MPSPASQVQPVPQPLTRRQEHRQATIEEIKTLARRQLAEQGPGALSLRAIARQMRITPSALYRYFAGYDELITALCVDAYESLATAVIAVQVGRPVEDHGGRWWAICLAYRDWSLAHRADFALIFGTPVPGYQAPEDVTGPAAGRLLALMLDTYGAAVQAGAAHLDETQAPPSVEGGELLRSLLGQLAPAYPSRLAAVVLSAWASLLGFLVVEIFGSMSQLIAEPEQLYQAHTRTVMLGMGYQPALVKTVGSRPPAGSGAGA